MEEKTGVTSEPQSEDFSGEQVTGPDPKKPPLSGAAMRAVALVAGTGFEPVTFRL